MAKAKRKLKTNEIPSVDELILTAVVDGCDSVDTITHFVRLNGPYWEISSTDVAELLVEWERSGGVTGTWLPTIGGIRVADKYPKRD